MTKSELIAALAKETHFTQQDAELAVNTIFDSMAERLAEGGRVEIRGFGSFETRLRAERLGRNPKTGEKVQVEEKRVPAFKAGKGLKEMVNKQ